MACTRKRQFPSKPGTEEHSSKRTKLQEDPPTLTAKALRELAKAGGPDLSDLRGYHNMSSRLSRKSSRASLQSSSTTPYDSRFDQLLTDSKIHPCTKSYERPPDFQSTIDALAQARQHDISQKKFKTFLYNNHAAKDEDEVMHNVIPHIIGERTEENFYALNTLFTKFHPLTNGTAQAKPDVYYGEYPESLNRSIRDDLAEYIIPSAMDSKPLLPNLFIQVKGPDGKMAVALRQARHDGALGARAIHSMRKYVKDAPQYNGEILAFTVTYNDGTIKFFAHSIKPPATKEETPEYFMTQLRAIAMTDCYDRFVEGVCAFMNLRDLAHERRKSLISAANENYNACSSGFQDLNDADNALQQHIAGYDSDESSRNTSTNHTPTTSTMSTKRSTPQPAKEAKRKK